MAEQIAASFDRGMELDSFPPTPHDDSSAQNIVDIDDFRKHLDRLKTRQKIAEAAFKFTHSAKFLPEPVAIQEHSDGSTSATFSESETGYYGDENATHTLNGWSDGPETERIITVHYDLESNRATAGYVHPRNRRFLQSDIRTQLRMGGYESKLQVLHDEVRNHLRDR